MSSINQATVFYFINLLVTIINYNKGENKTKQKKMVKQKMVGF